MSKLGRLIIAEEMKISVNTQNGEEQKYIGHPSLAGGGRARISGELRFKADPDNPSSGKFYINNDSGRFSKFADRNEMQLKRVAELFRKAGLAVETVYKSGKRPRPVAGLQVSDWDGEVILPDKKQSSTEGFVSVSITAPAR